MPSSRTEDVLSAVARCYDAALEAVLRDDIDRVESLLLSCEDQVRSLQDAKLDNVLEQGARDRARDSYGRLLDALKQARTATQRELEQVWKGQHALAGYGGRSEATGVRVSSDV